MRIKDRKLSSFLLLLFAAPLASAGGDNAGKAGQAAQVLTADPFPPLSSKYASPPSAASALERYIRATGAGSTAPVTFRAHFHLTSVPANATLYSAGPSGYRSIQTASRPPTSFRM